MEFKIYYNYDTEHFYKIINETNIKNAKIIDNRIYEIEREVVKIMIKVDKTNLSICGQENEIVGELGVIMEKVFEGELKIESFRVNKKENTGKKDIEEILDKLPDDLSKMLKHLL